MVLCCLCLNRNNMSSGNKFVRIEILDFSEFNRSDLGALIPDLKKTRYYGKGLRFAKNATIKPW